MPSIYIAALIPTIVGLGIIGGLLWWLAPAEQRKLLGIIILFELPLCAGAYYLIRQPIDGLLQRVISPFSDGYRLLSIFYAPLTEEPVKLLVLLIPPVFIRLNRSNFLFIAVAIGLGFGIGELWFLAYEFSQVPGFASLPWYNFGGFIQERFLVLVMHGAFTGAALLFFRKKRFMVGFLIAVLLHYIGNFPIFLAAINFGGLSTADWKIILLIWTQFYFLAMVGFLTLLFIKVQKPAANTPKTPFPGRNGAK